MLSLVFWSTYITFGIKLRDHTQAEVLFLLALLFNGQHLKRILSILSLIPTHEFLNLFSICLWDLSGTSAMHSISGDSHQQMWVQYRFIYFWIFFILLLLFSLKVCLIYFQMCKSCSLTAFLFPLGRKRNWQKTFVPCLVAGPVLTTDITQANLL